VYLNYHGEEVDLIKVGRYTSQELTTLMAELGLARDDDMTWEKKKAAEKLEQIFTGKKGEL